MVEYSLFLLLVESWASVYFDPTNLEANFFFFSESEFIVFFQKSSS